MFSKIIRTIYLYLVCLISLFMIVGGLISAISEIAEIVFPSNYYSTAYDEYTDKEYFSDNYNLTDEQFDKYMQAQKEERNAEYELEMQRRKNNNIKGVINSLSFVIVGLPIYIYNWRKIEKEKDIAITNNTESEGV
ncbi:MAG: hypothetical protein E7311_05445 [Clostridiales bacterium]|nr:hypothetical protein [Clostridiales bacterium]